MQKQQDFIFSQQDVRIFLKEKYDLKNIQRMFSLGSYVDCNYYIRNDQTDQKNQLLNSKEFVIKFTSLKEEPDQIFFQTSIMSYLNKNALNFKVSNIIPSKNNKMVEKLDIKQKTYYARLIQFVKGKNFAQIQYQSKGQFSVQFLLDSFQFEFGKSIRELSLLLNKIEYEKIQYQGRSIDVKNLPNVYDIWNITQFMKIRPYLLKIQKSIEKQMFDTGIALFEIFQNNEMIKNKMLKLSISHHDASGQNVILSDIQGKYKKRRVLCILDFGDLVYSYSISELVAALAHLPSIDKNPETLLNKYAKVIVGYLQVKQLSQCEWDVLILLIYARLAQVYLLGHYFVHENLRNPHVLLTTAESWQFTQILKRYTPSTQYKFTNMKDHIQMQTEILKSKVKMLKKFTKQIQL